LPGAGAVTVPLEGAAGIAPHEFGAHAGASLLHAPFF
jgi:hypothetical protein